tara:strand:- start:363 stop:545 length:183 start_codon:yes stop_codon:yes gene_type:complete
MLWLFLADSRLLSFNTLLDDPFGIFTGVDSNPTKPPQQIQRGKFDETLKNMLDGYDLNSA